MSNEIADCIARIGAHYAAPQQDSHVHARACERAYAAGREWAQRVASEETALSEYYAELCTREPTRSDADFRNAFRAGHRAVRLAMHRERIEKLRLGAEQDLRDEGDHG